MSLLGLFNQTITIYGQTSYDTEGREVVGAGVSVQARFQLKKRTIFSPRGASNNAGLLTIDALVYVPPGTTVEIDDKVSYDGQDYKVYGKYPTPDGNGQVKFIRLELVKWQAT